MYPKSNRLNLASLAAAVLFSGCASLEIPAEQANRDRADRIDEQRSAELPLLNADSSPDDFLRYALLNHPSVEAAFRDWRASIESIAPARSLPDPQLTFQADLSDTLMSLMPGLMFDFMTPGKRSALGQEAAAASEVAYQAFLSTVQQTAAHVRNAWIELAHADELIRLRETKLALLDQSLALSQAAYETGRGMPNFDPQLSALNDAAKTRSEIGSVIDHRSAARSRFKSALGLLPDDTDPPWPNFAMAAKPLLTESELWIRAQSANTEIAALSAMVDRALAGVEVARKESAPDFALGAMLDLKANPLMVRPAANLSLPIWRQKIAANIAAAESRRDAAIARLDARRLDLAAALSQARFKAREAERAIAYIDTTALPNLDSARLSAEASYQSGKGDPAMIPGLEIMKVNLLLQRADAHRQRDIALTDLLLMVADVGPTGTAVSVTIH